MDRRILVVDDTPDLLDSIREFLRMEGYDVITSVNGKDALEKVALFNPHLIITDLLMPVMDGFALIEHVNNNPLTANIPIIVYSAKPEQESQDRVKALGARAFVIKPSTLEHLLQCVQQLINP